MKRIFSLLSKQHVGAKASIILAFFTLLSQILALVRDMTLARMVGVGTNLDIYFSAFRIPDMIYVILSSLVAATVLVPLLHHEEKKGKSYEYVFVQSVMSFVFLMGVVIIGLVYVLLPYIASSAMPGLSIGDTNTYIHVSRILLLSPALLTLSALFASINQKIGAYISFGITGVVYNLGIILGTIFLYPNFGVEGLVMGVVIGCVLHLLSQIIGAKDYLKHLSLFPRKISFAFVKELAVFAFPRSAALFFAQLQMFLLVGFLSYAGIGAVSSFYFAYNLQSVFLSLIGASISVAVFSTLSRSIVLEEYETYQHTLRSGIQTILFLSVPATAISLLLSQNIVDIAYGSRAHTSELSNYIPLLFSIAVASILFQSLGLLFARAHYAARSSRVPLIAQIVPSVLFVVYGLLVQNNLVMGDEVLVAGMIVFALGAIVQFCILAVTLPHRKGASLYNVREISHFILGGIIASGLSYVVNIYISKTFILYSFFAILTKSVCITLLFIAIYSIYLLLVRSEEYLKYIKIFHTKIYNS